MNFFKLLNTIYDYELRKFIVIQLYSKNSPKTIESYGIIDFWDVY